MAEPNKTSPSVDYIKKGTAPPRPPIPRQELTVPVTQGQDPPPKPPPKVPYRD